MPRRRFSRIVTQDPMLARLQESVASGFSGLDQVELIDGNLVKGVTVSTTEKAVAHRLGRRPNGYLVSGLKGNEVVYSSKESSDRFLYLKLGKQADLHDIYAQVTIGATGAPTLVTAGDVSDGVKSITRSTNGKYTLTFGTSAAAVLYDTVRFSEMTVKNPTTDDVRYQENIESVGTDGVLKFMTLTGATATDPASGSTLRLHFVLEKTTTVTTDVWVF